MAFFYLQESKEQNKLKLKINSILNKIEENIDENKILITLPIKKDSKLKRKKIKKFVEKICKYNVKSITLSSNLYDKEILKNELYAMNINILNGQYLFKFLTEEIINYICKKSKQNPENLEIAILTNDVSNTNKQIIMELSERVKIINIVTNHINEFRALEDVLYNDKGIMIKLSNNYKKALIKADIIINIDFPEEIFNKYLIPNKCIIINMNNGIKIKSKKFNGVNISDYNINMPKKYQIEGFRDEFVYENYVFNKEYTLARKQIVEDKIKIKNLIGENGVIDSKEFI